MLLGRIQRGVFVPLRRVPQAVAGVGVHRDRAQAIFPLGDVQVLVQAFNLRFLIREFLAPVVAGGLVLSGSRLGLAGGSFQLAVRGLSLGGLRTCARRFLLCLALFLFARL